MARDLLSMMSASPKPAEVQKLLDHARSQVDYNVVDFTVEILTSKLREEVDAQEGDAYVPEYQRPFVWSDEDKSYFIESLLLRMPVPPLFFYDREGRLEVVDGSQRLRTAKEYIKNNFVLEGLEKLDFLNGSTFDDLPEIAQRRFRNTPVRAFILSEKTAPGTRFDIFRRLNTSGKTLTDAQVRKGAFPGPLTDLVIEMASLPLVRKLCPIGKTKNAEGELQELSLRFFAYSDSYLKFRHDVADFLNDFLIAGNKWAPTKVKAAKEEFLAVMRYVDAKFPYGFRRNPKASLTPRVRFEAIAVGVCLALRAETAKAKPDFSWLDSDEFKKLTRTDASNSGPKLRMRIEYVRDQVSK